MLSPRPRHSAQCNMLFDSVSLYSGRGITIYSTPSPFSALPQLTFVVIWPFPPLLISSSYRNLYCHIHISACLPACPSVCLPACLPGCLSVCLSLQSRCYVILTMSCCLLAEINLCISEIIHWDQRLSLNIRYIYSNIRYYHRLLCYCQRMETQVKLAGASKWFVF